MSQSHFSCSILDKSPTFPALLHMERKGKKVRVLERIGPHYEEFGILLLEDDTGAMMEAIKMETYNRVADINVKIARHWLRGRGKMPVYWRTLVEVLLDIGLNELADDITDVLSGSGKQHYPQPL